MYQIGDDAELLKHVTSANIACGFHAGDPATMRRTVKLAVDQNVAIGAHPGLPDLIGFGRRAMEITPQQAYDLVVYQVGALQAFATAHNARVQHVKPHGALYNMAAADPQLAAAIAHAVRDVDARLILVGLSGSHLIRAAENAGLVAANEVFADRTYQADGSITPRKLPGAMVGDAQTAAVQVLRMVREGVVVTREGIDLPVQADTVCIHGDGLGAVAFAAAVRRLLAASGVEVAPLGAILSRKH